MQVQWRDMILQQRLLNFVQLSGTDSGWFSHCFDWMMAWLRSKLTYFFLPSKGETEFSEPRRRENRTTSLLLTSCCCSWSFFTGRHAGRLSLHDVLMEGSPVSLDETWIQVTEKETTHKDERYGHERKAEKLVLLLEIGLRKRYVTLFPSFPSFPGIPSFLFLSFFTQLPSLCQSRSNNQETTFAMMSRNWQQRTK